MLQSGVEVRSRWSKTAAKRKYPEPASLDVRPTASLLPRVGGDEAMGWVESGEEIKLAQGSRRNDSRYAPMRVVIACDDA